MSTKITEIPLENKVCLVTGANAGIGFATALGLAERGATVVLHARNPQKGEAALTDIRQRSGNERVHLLLADLASQAQIRQMAAEFQQRFARLDVLVNNAGIIPLRRQESADGLEMQFAVNHLAYFLLTNLLLDVLKTSAPARIVNVSSMVHTWGRIDWDDLQHERHYDATGVYAETKRMNVLFTAELARRLQGTGVTANCLHPGVIATKLNIRYAGNDRASTASLAELRRGAETSLYLATSPEVAGVSGRYFVGGRERETAVLQDSTSAQKLWQISERLVQEGDLRGD